MVIKSDQRYYDSQERKRLKMQQLAADQASQK